ncbi:MULTISPECIES: glycosyltransferase [Paenibacillus]|uniref:glycosyltransferase family protein n=1 Tax=Paenibacillus TaxID=44249 RepID=UPI000B839E9D|nr:glycosyltransferase [Paenibacillus amylolyticus]
MGLKVLFTNTSSLIKYGISSGFKNLGHEVHIMDGKYQLWDKDKETQVQLFKDYIENNHVDIVFSECFANFAEGIFEHTREKGIFHALWSIEDTPFDHWIGDYWSDYADYIFTTTAECLPNYWNKGKQAELMLFGCNPDFHKNTDSGVQRDIVLIANNYERRFEQTRKFIMPVVENGYDVSVFGNEWWMDSNREVNLISYPSVYRGYGAYEDLPYLYSSSKIILGQNLDDKSITQTSMRPAESLAVGGGILISPFTPAQQYLFHDHVYLPRNTDEILLMVNEVLGMTDIQREQKAKKAQEFVYRYHNYNLRAELVINAYHGYKP